MSSNTRNTTRISASIDSNVATDLEKYADEVNETKSRIVEQALSEFLNKDRLSEMDEKLDQVLARLDGSEDPAPSLAENSGEKEKENQTSSDGSLEYDPDADRDQELTTDEIHEIISQEDPLINPEHIGNRMPRDSGPRLEVILACARYDKRHPERDEPQTIHKKDVEGIIKEVLGSSDHFIDKYTPLVLGELHHLKKADTRGEIHESDMCAFGPEGRRDWYSNYITADLASVDIDFFTNQGDLRQYRAQVDGLRDEFLDLGIVDEELWQACRDNLFQMDISQLPLESE